MTHPAILLFGVLFYALGAGIARYSGAEFSWNSYFWGQVWVTTVQLSTHLIWFFFEAERKTFLSDKKTSSQFKIPGISDRHIALYGGVVCLCALIPVFLWLVTLNKVNITVAFVMVAIILIGFINVIPPWYLVESGYGEIGSAIGLVFLIPLISFLLQGDQNPRIILLVTFPLLLAHLVMQLVYELKNYSLNIKYGKMNMMIRFGWQNGVIFITLSVIFSLLLIFLSYFLGLPRFVLYTGLVLLPVGLTLIWLVIRIASGRKPYWGATTITSTAFLLLMAYLFTIGFWTN